MVRMGLYLKVETLATFLPKSKKCGATEENNRQMTSDLGKKELKITMNESKKSMQNKNVILADYDVPEEWEFRVGLENSTSEKWTVNRSVANTHHTGMGNLVRYMKYFMLPFKTFLHRKNIKNVIAWQQFFGFGLSFFLKLFDVKVSPNIYIMEMIYKPKNGLLGRIYFNYVNYSIHNACIKRIFCFSNHEIDLYSKTFNIPKTMFQVLQLGIEDSYDKFQDVISDDGYYLAAGRSNRDYDFLISSWDKSRKLRIICDSGDYDSTESIEIIRNVYNDDYLMQLSKCHCVIIPLKDTNISSGQLVVLQAMMLGKPVIVSENLTISEYMTDGNEGIVITNTKQCLDNAITSLEDSDYYGKLALNARQKFISGYTVSAMARKVAEVIKNE